MANGNDSGVDGVRDALTSGEDVVPLASDGVVGPDDAAPSSDDAVGGSEGGLPDGFPVQPLGQSESKFYFLSARGQLVEVSAQAMANRNTLMALVSGTERPVQTLADLGEPKSRDVGFNPAKVSDRLMMACSALPLFDPVSMSIRHVGTWRGSTAVPIVHCGEQVLSTQRELRQGRMIGGALYPATPSRPLPDDEVATLSDIKHMRDRLQHYWSWQSPDVDADVLMGWVAQAVLGQYPKWRTHAWLKGRLGSGKSTLLGIVHLLLGGMCTGVQKASSAAAIRQTSNRQAIARLFDEAESDGTGRMEEVVSLFRLMSDQDGARVQKGTSDHHGITFELYGAGFMASIIPGVMTPADRSRFVVLSIGERPKADRPEDIALSLADLKEDAAELGPKIWRRMINIASTRWDTTFSFYGALIQGMGAEARTGDTIGAILAGWDLITYDTHVREGELDQDRIRRAKEIAAPLIGASIEAADEGEGERCLRSIMVQLVTHKGGSLQCSIAELIEQMQRDSAEAETGAHDGQATLGRIGLRVMDIDPYNGGEVRARGERRLFIANGEHPLLDRMLGNTRWRGGGHRAALETLAGVEKAQKPVRVGGTPRRGLLIPARYLPGGNDVDAASDAL